MMINSYNWFELFKHSYEEIMSNEQMRLAFGLGWLLWVFIGIVLIVTISIVWAVKIQPKIDKKRKRKNKNQQ